MKKFYVYRITNIKENKHYYGSRSTNINPINDLGIKYFSSSTDKNFINEQKLHNDRFIYKIIKIFDIHNSALELEIRLHNIFQVHTNPKFYNKAKQTSTAFVSSFAGHTHTEEHKAKMSLLNKGKELSKECKEKISKSKLEGFASGKIKKPKGKLNGMYGKKHSKTSKKLMSIAGENKIISDKTRKLHSNNWLGTKNPNALKILIYNNEDQLMFTCLGNFSEICYDNNLPYRNLLESYQNNSKKIYMNKASTSQLKNKKMLIYIGWYAIKIGKLSKLKTENI